ncbi:kinesin-domain-containing protein [Ascodesmis nigricans]|uniref:Kinesin-domain-containing protein n=1 Tax=Ascodesmis nigricans TaxID=341454 RepID=A0A4S2N3U0_9PEZI|nr:kinesin-domain-containing protein [Ascodesmis nigricans]
MSGSSRNPSASARHPTGRLNQSTSMRPPPRSQSVLSNASRLGPHPGIASSPIAPSHGRRNLNASPTRQKRDHHANHDDGNREMNINVVVRCRTRSHREIQENSGVVVSTPGGLKGTEVELSMGPMALSNKTYTFDRAFGPEADQSQIYDNVVEPMLDEMLSGYNCTIFAYGQTGTGKTYTMTGDMSDNFGTYADQAGIIPRTLYNLFKRLGPDNADNSVKCSFVELYNEELKDLLSSPEAPSIVKIFDDSARKGGIILQGMEESYIKSAAEGVKLLQEGSLKRQVAATKCNDLSSRSHTVFTITVHAKYINDDGEDMLTTGKLNLVDLAGSENIGRSGAENKRAREAGMINQSLLTLGRVINALVDKSQHIPYRESKLTRLLQDSLGGRTKTCIIATISPAKSNLEETISTLDYAARAKNIRNKPQINQMLTKKTLLREYVTEIERLKADLKAARTKHGVFLTQESFDEITEQNESRRILVEENERKVEMLEHQIQKKQEQFENSMKLFLETQQELHSLAKVLDETKETLAETESTLDVTKKEAAEQTILRQHHERTEEKLATIGQNLISTAGITIKDLNGLHSKIGRMAELEIVNHTKFHHNKTLVSEFTRQIQQETDDFADSQREVTDKLEHAINEFVEASLEKLRQASTKNEELEERFAEHNDSLMEGAEISKDGMNEVLEEIKILREEVKQKIGDGLKGMSSAAERMAAGVIKDLETLGTALTASYDRLRKDVELAMAANKAHVEAQEKQISELRNQVESATATAAKNAADAEAKLNNVLVEERAQAAEDRKDLITKISALIEATGIEQDKRLTTRIDVVRSDLSEAQIMATASMESCKAEMETITKAEEAHMEAIADAETRICNFITEDSEAVTSHFTTITTTANAIHADTVSLVASQTDSIALQLSALDDFVTRARQQNEEHHKTFTSLFSTLSSTATSSFNANSNLIENSSSDLNTFRTETSTIPPQLDTLREKFTSHTQERLGEMQEKIDETSLKEYEPTGHTPKKRKYPFDTFLPRTAPHDEILGKKTPTATRGILPPGYSQLSNNADELSDALRLKSEFSAPDGLTLNGTANNNNHNAARVPLGNLQVNSPVKRRHDDHDIDANEDDPKAAALAALSSMSAVSAAAAAANTAGLGAAFYPSFNKKVSMGGVPMKEEEEIAAGKGKRKRVKRGEEGEAALPDAVGVRKSRRNA